MDQPQVFSVVLTRPENSVSWGFRLQGGADFATPLSIQLVSRHCSFGLSQNNRKTRRHGVNAGCLTVTV